MRQNEALMQRSLGCLSFRFFEEMRKLAIRLKEKLLVPCSEALVDPMREFTNHHRSMGGQFANLSF